MESRSTVKFQKLQINNTIIQYIDIGGSVDLIIGFKHLALPVQVNFVSALRLPIFLAPLGNEIFITHNYYKNFIVGGRSTAVF